MSFPITHLRVADLVAQRMQLDNTQTAALLLGALAPDGVHYRARFAKATQSGIGAAKKLSHLCPPGNERWGQVTDNVGWVAEATRIHRGWQHDGADYLAMGYIVHVLTDIYNNKTIWHNFRTQYPLEAMKGYAGDYYTEVAALDIALYHEAETERIMRLLPQAEVRDFAGRVAANEIDAVRAGLYAQQNRNLTVYVGSSVPDVSAHTFVTQHQMERFITDATDFVAKIVNN